MYDPKKHNRRSIRLKGYDYSRAGLYFITLCCQGRAHLLGGIEKNEMRPNGAGQMVATEWLALTERFPHTRLHEFIVMPNHFHGILEIIDTPVGPSLVGGPDPVGGPNPKPKNKPDQVNDFPPENPESGLGGEEVGGQPRGLPQRISQLGSGKGVRSTVGDIVGAFKSITTVAYIRGVKESGWASFDRRLWQRNYYEHIIRNEAAYTRIANYIINNPANWEDDKFSSP